jgi:hypothetical protein
LAVSKLAGKSLMLSSVYSIPFIFFVPENAIAILNGFPLSSINFYRAK